MLREKFSPIKNWSDGIKRITGQERHIRAEEYFLRFVDDLAFALGSTRDHFGIVCYSIRIETQKPFLLKRTLADWRREGFVELEPDSLRKGSFLSILRQSWRSGSSQENR
jgi:hypothetical protein